VTDAHLAAIGQLTQLKHLTVKVRQQQQQQQQQHCTCFAYDSAYWQQNG
jgi:hypothetical protein